MANTICTSEQFTTEGGVLHLAASAMPRVVLETTTASTGDGEITSHSPMTGQRILIDQRGHWKNDFGVPVKVQVHIQRARRTMSTTCPHTVFLRESYTTRVGTDRATQIIAPTPTTNPDWNTEWGFGLFAPFNRMGGDEWPPITTWQSTPEATTVLNEILVPVGQSLDVRFRVGLVTDAYVNVPWEDAHPGNNYPRAFVWAFRNTMRMVATPLPV